MMEMFSNIIQLLQSTTGAGSALKQKFIDNGWIGPNSNPTEEELVKTALGRIKQDVKEYEKFVSTLDKVDGMNLIVKNLPGMTIKSLLL